MHDHPGGFVDRNQVLIFEKNVERGWVFFDGSALRECRVRNVDRQLVAGCDSRRGAPNGSPIDADGSSIDPRLNPGAGGLEIRQMPAEHEVQPFSRVAAVPEKCTNRHLLATIVSEGSILLLSVAPSKRNTFFGFDPIYPWCAPLRDRMRGTDAEAWLTASAPSRGLPVDR